MALFHTFPLTPGGRPNHHSSLTFLLPFLREGRRGWRNRRKCECRRSWKYSSHVIAQAVYIVAIEKHLMLFQGDERKEDCTLLGKVKLNAFRSSTSNPWVIDKLQHNA